MNVRVGLWRKLSTKKLMLLKCGVGEDSWESLGLQGDQSWIFTGRTDAEAETSVLWPPHMKSWLIAKDPDAGRDWGQEEKGTTEDAMAGWHHRLDGCGFGRTPGVGDGQGGLACCNCGVTKSRTRLSDWTDTQVYQGSLIAQSVIHLQCRRLQFYPWVRKICWRRNRLPTPVLLGFPCGLAGKESACNVVDLGWIPGLERSPREEKGYPLQYYGLENFIDCIVYGATKSLGSQRSDMTERLSPSHTQVSRHISLTCQLKWLKSNDSPIAKITRTIHILVSNTSS